MQLYGSTTSPFVRRIRILLEQLKLDCQFENIDIFSSAGRELLKAKNPTLKVPALVDGEHCIYDSRVIFRYLGSKTAQADIAPLTWHEENLLTLIDAANDSLVTLLISMRSDIDVNSDAMFYRIQHERVHDIYQLLEKAVVDGEFSQWRYPAICLYCLVDWAVFRELKLLGSFPALTQFLLDHSAKTVVNSTDPRL